LEPDVYFYADQLDSFHTYLMDPDKLGFGIKAAGLENTI
jgi:hypothetical protein